MAIATILLTPHARAQDGATDAASRATLSRSLRSSAFLGAQVDARYKNAVYAEDAQPGPSSQSTLRASVYGSGDVGPLGLYLGLGTVARPFSNDPTLGDPFRDPYDDFTFGRNVRLFSAYVEYVGKDEDRRRVWSVRAGRLTDLDRTARLLMFDGARLALNTGPARWTAYGGRRAVLDGNFEDGANDALAWLVAGAGLKLDLGAVDLEAAYKLESLHRAIVRGGFAAGELVYLDLSAEARIGGRASVEAYDAAFGVQRDDLGLALVLRHDGSAQNTTASVLVDWRLQMQLGRDPVTFGRGGLGPDASDVQAAMGVPLSSALLDRLFLGPQTAHVLAEAEARWWPVTAVVVAVGGFTRQPLSAADKTSMRPAIVEVYGGPEFRVTEQIRVGTEARFAVEDPGEPGRVFASTGSGERQSGAVRLYAEVPLSLGAWRVALRPEGEASTFRTRGPLSVTNNQNAYFGGVAALVSYHSDFWALLRYGAGTIPSFFADGVRFANDLQLTVGGRY